MIFRDDSLPTPGRKLAWCLLAAFLSCGGGGEMREPDPDALKVGAAVYLANNPSMPCDWVRVYEEAEELYLSVLWKTPGDSIACLKKWFDDPRPKWLLVQLSNGVCRRKENCPANEPTEAEIADIALEVSALVAAYCPDCKLILSPQLEDNWTDAEACEHAEAISAVSTAETSRNPVHGENLGASIDCFDYIELHNTEREHFPPGKPCIYSNDGYDLEVGNTIWSLPQRVSAQQLEHEIRSLPDCVYLLWTADTNCLHGDTSGAPYVGDRRCALDAGTVTDLTQLIGGIL